MPMPKMASMLNTGRKPASTTVAPGGGSVDVSTPFHPPTAAYLLADGVRGINRPLRRAKALLGSAGELAAADDRSASGPR